LGGLYFCYHEGTEVTKAAHVSYRLRDFRAFVVKQLIAAPGALAGFFSARVAGSYSAFACHDRGLRAVGRLSVDFLALHVVRKEFLPRIGADLHE
jgi:hypothetical protein